MDYIDKLLETEEGAKTLKAHLKSVPKYEKAKPQFQRLWQLACDAVNKHHNINKPAKASARHCTTTASSASPSNATAVSWPFLHASHD